MPRRSRSPSLSSRRSGAASSQQHHVAARGGAKPSAPLAPAEPADGAEASEAAPHAPPPSSFSFACGGWLMVYHFGVAKALQQFGLEQRARVIGCSAGALAATALALRCDFDEIRDYLLAHVVPKAHASLGGPFQVRSYLRATLAATGGLHRFEQLNRSAQLTVVYSSLSAWASRRVSTFASQEHLEQSLLASCCAPPIAGMPFRLGGEWVMDGGVFDFQPVLGRETVTVSPFYCTGADIKPSRYVPMWWALFPPGARDVEWLFDLGYEDGLRWVLRRGLQGAAGAPVAVPSRGAASDGEWTTTLGRFIGYRGCEIRVLDVLFVGLFVCVWKPLVFALLYLELYLQALIAGGKAAVFGAAAKLMASSLVLAAGAAALATLGPQDTLLLLGALAAAAALLGAVVLLGGGAHAAARAAAEDWQKCRACMRSITSLSLFLRSVPVLGASVRLKRHESLLKHSFVYRVTLHFV